MRYGIAVGIMLCNVLLSAPLSYDVNLQKFLGAYSDVSSSSDSADVGGVEVFLGLGEKGLTGLYQEFNGSPGMYDQISDVVIQNDIILAKRLHVDMMIRGRKLIVENHLYEIKGRFENGGIIINSRFVKKIKKQRHWLSSYSDLYWNAGKKEFQGTEVRFVPSVDVDMGLIFQTAFDGHLTDFILASEMKYAPLREDELFKEIDTPGSLSFTLTNQRVSGTFSGMVSNRYLVGSLVLADGRKINMNLIKTNSFWQRAIGYKQ